LNGPQILPCMNLRTGMGSSEAAPLPLTFKGPEWAFSNAELTGPAYGGAARAAETIEWPRRNIGTSCVPGPWSNDGYQMSSSPPRPPCSGPGTILGCGRQPAVECRNGNSQEFGHFPRRRARPHELARRFHLALGHKPLPAPYPALTPGCLETCPGTLDDQLPLHLGQTGHDMEEEPPRRRRGVDLVGQALEVYLAPLELSHQVDQPLHPTPQAIQLPDHQGIARPDVGQGLPEPWPVRPGPAHLVGEQPLASGPIQGIRLQGQVLVLGGHPGVADAHGGSSRNSLQHRHSRILFQERISRMETPCFSIGFQASFRDSRKPPFSRNHFEQ
jgi:hypothetical protein